MKVTCRGSYRPRSRGGRSLLDKCKDDTPIKALFFRGTAVLSLFRSHCACSSMHLPGKNPSLLFRYYKCSAFCCRSRRSKKGSLSPSEYSEEERHMSPLSCDEETHCLPNWSRMNILIFVFRRHAFTGFHERRGSSIVARIDKRGWRRCGRERVERP